MLRKEKETLKPKRAWTGLIGEDYSGLHPENVGWPDLYESVIYNAWKASLFVI